MGKEISLMRDQKEDYQYEEAIKTLRTNIQFSGTNLQVIMLTSAVPNEGKSEISFSLASSLAQIDNRVLLIDADVRKSVLVTRYKLDRKIEGLSQYLSGQKKLEEVIYTTNIPNLDVIFSGPLSPNPAELLEEPLFKKLIDHARELRLRRKALELGAKRRSQNNRFDRRTVGKLRRGGRSRSS